MSTVKILAIGNSFSQDATRYLHQTALAAGVAEVLAEDSRPGAHPRRRSDSESAQPA